MESTGVGLIIHGKITIGGMGMVMGLAGPVAGRALPVAFKLSGRIIPAISARAGAGIGGAGIGGGLFGIGWKGLITQGLAVWAGMEALDALVGLNQTGT